MHLLGAIQRGLNAAHLAALDLIVFDACLMASVEMVSLLDGYHRIVCLTWIARCAAVPYDENLISRC